MTISGLYLSQMFSSNRTNPSPECVSSDTTRKFLRKSAFSCSDRFNIRVIDWADSTRSRKLFSACIRITFLGLWGSNFHRSLPVAKRMDICIARTDFPTPEAATISQGHCVHKKRNPNRQSDISLAFAFQKSSIVFESTLTISQLSCHFW